MVMLYEKVIRFCIGTSHYLYGASRKSEEALKYLHRLQIVKDFFDTRCSQMIV